MCAHTHCVCVYFFHMKKNSHTENYTVRVHVYLSCTKNCAACARAARYSYAVCDALALAVSVLHVLLLHNVDFIGVLQVCTAQITAVVRSKQRHENCTSCTCGVDCAAVH